MRPRPLEAPAWAWAWGQVVRGRDGDEGGMWEYRMEGRLEEEGWFVTFNLHWSPMALTRKKRREEEEITYMQEHPNSTQTHRDAGCWSPWMNTRAHTHVQGCCQRTYGPCHCMHTLSVRSLMGSERTLRQRTVTPLIRGDMAALWGQSGGHYYHRPYHKFTFRAGVFQ